MFSRSKASDANIGIIVNVCTWKPWLQQLQPKEYKRLLSYKNWIMMHTKRMTVLKLQTCVVVKNSQVIRCIQNIITKRWSNLITFGYNFIVNFRGICRVSIIYTTNFYSFVFCRISLILNPDANTQRFPC